MAYVNIEFQPAYVLHTRPFRDTSLIVTFLTQDFGLVSAVARGQRQSKSKRSRVPLTPFSPLLISLKGKSSLKLLSHFELTAPAIQLQARALYSGLYLNELLIKLLKEWDTCESLYADYAWALNALNEASDIEIILRQFERSLLECLGVNISWTYEAFSDREIDANRYYRLDAEAGFVVSTANSAGAISGDNIRLVAGNVWRDPAARRTAKVVHRLLFERLLGGKELQARQLFT